MTSSARVLVELVVLVPVVVLVVVLVNVPEAPLAVVAAADELFLRLGPGVSRDCDDCD